MPEANASSSEKKDNHPSLFSDWDSKGVILPEELKEQEQKKEPSAEAKPAAAKPPEPKKEETQIKKPDEVKPPEPPKKEELIAGRFKTQEEFDKAQKALVDDYKKKEADYTRKCQELKVLENKKKEIEKQIEDSKPKATPEEIFEKLSTDPVSVIKPIVDKAMKDKAESESAGEQPEVSQEVIDSAIDKFASEHKDFDTYKSKISEVIEKHIPAEIGLTPEKTLELAYNMAKQFSELEAKAKDVEKIAAEAKKAGAEEVINKGKGFLESGDEGRSADTSAKKTPEDEIRDSIVNAGKNNSPLFV